MVLDNADDIDTFFAKPTSTVDDSERSMPLINYLPRSSQGLMLITTRDKRISGRLTDTHTPIRVGPMSSLEAQELLLSRSKRPNGSNDDNPRILVDALEYIPLAITQAAAFIRENNLTLAEYLKLLRTDDSDLQDLLEEDLGDLRRDSESQNSVIRTWKLSYDLLSKQKPRAAEMLSLMAVLDRQGIPESLLRNDADRNIDIITALGVLQAFSLISAEDGGSGYEMHRLVQLATRKWLEMQGTKEKWQEKALLVLADIFPNGRFESWATCESLLPHAQMVTQYKNAKEGCPEEFAHLLTNIACFDMRQGRYEIAHTRSLAAFEVQKKISGLEHPSTLRSMVTLALIYWNQGRWDEAEKLQVQVMETNLRLLKEEHPNTLSSMNNLALTYQDQGRWDEAEKLQVQVVETRKRVLKEEHPDTLTSMSCLAATYWDKGRLDEAEKLQVQVIETRKRVLKEEHPDTLSSMNSLALTYQDQGRWDEAEKLQVQVMETRKRVLKEEHPDTLPTMNDLALTYRDQGRWDEAEKLQVQVMETSLRVLGEEHPNTLTSMSNLALTYWDQGRWDEAEKLEAQVIETRKRVLGEEHPNTLTRMNNLAVTYWKQGRRNEAIELMKKVVDLRTKTIGVNHPDTIDAVEFLNEWLDI